MSEKPIRLLIVEDEPAHAEAIRRALEAGKQRVDIRVVGSLREFRDAVAGEVPDLALMDLFLPDGRSESVLTHTPESGAFPITIMTSHGDEEAAVAAIKRGALDYIVKSPETFDAMPQIVDRTLREWNLRMDRKRAEETLQQRQAELQAVYDNAPFMLCVLDENRQIVLANRAFKAYAGRTDDSLESPTACGVLGCIHALDDPRGCGYGPKCGTCALRLALQDTIETGRSHQDVEHVTTLVRQGEQSDVTWLGSTAPIPMADKLRVLLVLQDITERKRSVKALRESEQRFRKVFEEAPFGMVLVSQTNGMFLRANAGFCRMLDYTEEELTRLTFVEVTHPEHRSEDVAAIKKLWAGRIPQYKTEKRYLKKNGAILWGSLTASLIMGEDGKPLCTLAMIEDITERKKTEEELTFHNVLLTTEQEVSPDGILVVDANDTILSFNQRFVEMWGIPPEALAGRSDAPVLKAAMHAVERPEQFLEKVKYLYAHHDETSRDEVTCKNGRTFERYSAPMFGPDGKYYGRVWNFRDITERVESQRALSDHQERLRAMALDVTLGEERERRRIAAGLHDQIGQTLALLCVRMERMAEDAGSTSIGDQCRDMLSTTRKALETTRSLTFELSSPVFYEFGLVAAVKWLGRELEEHSGIKFTIRTTDKFDAPEEDVAILLLQTIRELLTNVVKHSKARKCRTTFSSGKHQFVITVQDDGVGFDAGVAHSYKTTQGSFGLFIIQERLKGLGGDMTIESKPDHGSLIKLWIPRKHRSGDNKEGVK